MILKSSDDKSERNVPCLHQNKSLILKSSDDKSERGTLEASLASSNLPASSKGVRKRGSPTEQYTINIIQGPYHPIIGPASGPHVGASLTGGNIALNGFLA